MSPNDYIDRVADGVADEAWRARFREELKEHHEDRTERHPQPEDPERVFGEGKSLARQVNEAVTPAFRPMRLLKSFAYFAGTMLLTGFWFREVVVGFDETPMEGSAWMTVIMFSGPIAAAALCHRLVFSSAEVASEGWKGHASRTAFFYAAWIPIFLAMTMRDLDWASMLEVFLLLFMVPFCAGVLIDAFRWFLSMTKRTAR